MKFKQGTDETTEENTLSHPLIIHQELEECRESITTFEFHDGTYTNKEKNNFKGHLLSHKLCDSSQSLQEHDTDSLQNLPINNLGKDSRRFKEQLLTFKCQECVYATKRKDNLRRHLLTHLTPEERKKVIKHKATFECQYCKYRADRGFLMRKHLLIHNSIERCKIKDDKPLLMSLEYAHKTKRTDDLGTRSLFQNSPEELLKLSTFEIQDRALSNSTIKDQQKKQLLCFETISECQKSKERMPILECSQCTYSTKGRANLRRHLIVHKSSEERKVMAEQRPTFVCQQCTYKTKRKDILNKHVLIHMSSEERLTLKEKKPTFECQICTYRTKKMYHLKRHVLVHKTFEERQKLEEHMPTYGCQECTYTTKKQSNLRRHALIHKSPEERKEMPTFLCRECTYKTKRKDLVKKHELIHKSS